MRCKQKTQLCEMEVPIPHNRNDEYRSKIISKYQLNADGSDDKVL